MLFVNFFVDFLNFFNVFFKVFLIFGNFLGLNKMSIVIKIKINFGKLIFENIFLFFLLVVFLFYYYIILFC